MTLAHLQTSVLFSMILTTLATFALAADGPSPKVIPIPPEDGGYDGFESQVVATESEFAQFMSAAAKSTSWSDWAGFEKALKEADVDFDTQALVLIKQMEGSGSVRVNLDVVRTNRHGRLVCNVRRKIPGPGIAGTDDIAVHGFALVVEKVKVRVVDVRLRGDKEGFTPQRELDKYPLLLRVVRTAEDME